MSDLASMTWLAEMVSHKLVMDITIIGNGIFACNLALVDRTEVFGSGVSLQDAISDAYTKFKSKLNEHRN